MKQIALCIQTCRKLGEVYEQGHRYPIQYFEDETCNEEDCDGDCDYCTEAGMYIVNAFGEKEFMLETDYGAATVSGSNFKIVSKVINYPKEAV